MPEGNIVLYRQCAWCKHLVDEDGRPLPETLPDNTPGVTHCICVECNAIEMAKIAHSGEE